MEYALELQALGLVILVGGLVGLYRRAVVRRWTGLAREQHWLMFTIVAITAGGFIGAPFWWMDYAASFAWDLPPLASRLLAIAALAFGVVGAMVLRRPVPGLVRLLLAMATSYLAPLVAIIVLFHLDRLDWKAPITYGFLAIAAFVLLSSLWHLLARTRTPLAAAEAHRASPPVPVFLGLSALLCGLWGASLYATPNGMLPLLWIWPTDALTSALIGTMLLAIATISLMARTWAEEARTVLAAIMVYGVGAAAAGAANVINSKPLPIAYMVVLGLLGACAGLLLAGKLKDLR